MRTKLTACSLRCRRLQEASLLRVPITKYGSNDFARSTRRHERYHSFPIILFPISEPFTRVSGTIIVDIVMSASPFFT
jgi:hypothetical protein